MIIAVGTFMLSRNVNKNNKVILFKGKKQGMASYIQPFGIKQPDM
jgi:hypothetical protein